MRHRVLVTTLDGREWCECGLPKHGEIETVTTPRTAAGPHVDEPDGMTPNEMRRRWPANVKYIEDEARAAALALDVEKIAADAIGLFIEYRDKHGYAENMAQVAAVAEVIEGASAIDALRELRGE